MPIHRTGIRLINVDDAAAIAEHRVHDAKAFAPWEPAQPESFFTAEGQAARIVQALEGYRAGTTWPAVVLADGVIAGQVTLGTVLQQPHLRTASVGYWIATLFQNRGHATRAVGDILTVMKDELGLHRATANTRFDNLASQNVLRRNGFRPCGVIREHIFLDGAWHDVIDWEQVLQP